MEFYNKHYIRLDEHNRIIKGFSDAFEKPLEADICINEYGGRHFEIDGEINPCLVNMDGTHNFRYEEVELQSEDTEEKVFTKVVRKATDEELAEELATIPVPEPVPSDVEVLQEQMLDMMEMQTDLLMEMCELQLASE